MADLEFRDGVKFVPDHLADMMRGLDTHTMTLDEATRAANNGMITERFNQARQKLITDHFKNERTG